MSSANKRSAHLDERLALSIPEAARALGVGERMLRAQLAEVPHVHIGGRVVIPVDAMRAWLERRSRVEASQASRLAEELLRDLK